MPEYGVRTAGGAPRPPPPPPPPSTLHRRAEPRSRLSRRKYLVRSSTVVLPDRVPGSAGSGGVAPLLVHAGAELVEPGDAGRVGRRCGGLRALDRGLRRRATELLAGHAGPDLLEA